MRRRARRVGAVAAVSSLSRRRGFEQGQASAEQQVAAQETPTQQTAGAEPERAAVPSAPGPTGSASAAVDPARRIELLGQLATLHASGALTDEEFAQEKARLLS